MDLHGNAALSWSGRRELARRVVDQGWTLTAAADAASVSVRCARKWVGRYRAGDRQFFDHSSAPRRVANRTDPERVAVIVKLRRLRMTAAEIAETLAMPLSTVSGILTRIGMGRLGRLGLEPAMRYERSRPGELVHIDVKKLGRIVGGAGWRVRGGRQHYTGSYTDAAGWLRIRPHRRRRLQPPRLRRGAAGREGKDRRRLPSPRCRLLSPLRLQVEAIISDNGACYRSVVHALACRRLGLRHLHTRPRHPQTNGKAERFIRTMLAGWAYGAVYGSSRERTATLDGWLWHYNHRRRHSALHHQPPVSRTNLLGSYT
jgi:transposase